MKISLPYKRKKSNARYCARKGKGAWWFQAGPNARPIEKQKPQSPVRELSREEIRELESRLGVKP